MSERLAMAAVVAAVLSLPGMGAAQDRDLALQRRRLDQMARAWRASWVTAEEARRGHSLRVHLDTIRAGSVRIIVPPQLQGLGERVAERVWSRLDEWFGRAAAVVEGQVYVLQRKGQMEDVVAVADVRVVTFFVEPSASEDEVGRSVFKVAAAFVLWHSDNPLQEWLRYGSWSMPDLPLAFREGGDLAQQTYLHLALSPLSAVRGCFDNTPSSCRVALGLVVGDSITTWFSPADRLLVVLGLENQWRGRPQPLFDDREAVGRCIRGADSACVRLLRSLGRYRDVIHPPLGPPARALVTTLALELGGPGAYERLLRAGGRPIADRLAAAGGADADSLIALWRARVLAARPAQSSQMPRSALLVSAAWLAVLAVGAMGSAKWRQV